MNITVICPLYKAKNYIVGLHKSLMMQEKVDLIEVKYLLTNTNDGTENIIKDFEKTSLTVLEMEEFSHSLTREKAAMESNSDIIVFITQDILINDKEWLYKLCKPIEDGRCEAAFSRQICDNTSIERYTRMNNYPEESRIVSKRDIPNLGIMTFFFSDAASAIRTDVYKELNGYDNLDLLTNEDMYFSHKLINKGYRIMYNADAQIIHSHDYKFMQLFKRYFDQGVFLADNRYLLDYKANDSALKLLRFVVTKSLKEGNFKTLFNVIPNFTARYLGNKFGANYNRLPMEKIKKYSSNRYYWDRKNKQKCEGR